MTVNGSFAPSVPGILTGESLDWLLGDPDDPGTPFSYFQCHSWDQAEAFPEDACRELDRAGLQLHYVPTEHGGELRDVPGLLALLRVVARRDLTVAIAHAKTFLGSVCVWIAGSPEQAVALAQRIAVGVPVAWGLTERTHGSDLMADEFVAQPLPDGYLLNGEKWLINNATRAGVVCLLTRTSPNHGPRALSLLLLDKDGQPPLAFRNLPKIRTHGIRGADISGLVCDDAWVPASALIGEEGQGLATVLRALPLTRTVCTAMSLGAADHALVLATEFAAARELYGRRLIDLERTRRLLGACHTALLVAEAVSTVVGRSIHTLTAELPVSSAVAKSLVPRLIDQLITQTAEILGARSFLSDAYRDGRFQKLERDHRVVGIFDGNSFVNQNALINHFPVLARCYAAEQADAPGAAAAARLDGPLPALDFARLGLVSRHGSSVLQSLPSLVRQLHAEADQGGAEGLLALADRLLAHSAAVHTCMADTTPAPRDVPHEFFDLAVSYEWCFAGAAVLALWLHNKDRAARATDGCGVNVLWAKGMWAEAALTLVVHRLDCPGDPSWPVVGGDVFERVLAAAQEMRRQGAIFSLAADHADPAVSR